MEDGTGKCFQCQMSVGCLGQKAKDVAKLDYFKVKQ